ncbi:hypothetical protein Pla22_14300 [Rubripirellula amarantea]|uniref:Endonuclease/exonuclease/phosphatase domain-containing protein n=1 Tax=Rubripirellula amarantea TaxID=2527999 RepID=A0A5C5WT22_9BACT|nr:endonuclease/exonuclease/phosphatase family protein [Rubripirellula amarantea]TWT53797.1 hypothetical protein Pla22_14300 [Rubripirellula amarantea]
MLTVFNFLIYSLLSVLVLGSLLPLSSSPHWFIRNWDYPRVQIVTIAVVSAFAFLVVNGLAGELAKFSAIGVVVVSVAIFTWHTFRILPYTPLASTQVKTWEPEPGSPQQTNEKRLRVLLSNLEMENDKFDRWREVILSADADVVLVAEVDDRWAAVIEEMRSSYPNQIVYPQDNWYGLAMLSRLPILESNIRFLVQDDVPSIDAIVELQSGDRVRVVGVHPRPPEPVRDNDSTARDAELVLWSEELADEPLPTVIGGDLNDVAWSETTRLFLRLSGLLDPRRGRGLYNSFHADHVWMRFPLDHVFHSTHFSLRDLQRLPFVGSDHFPIFVDLQLDQDKRAEHEPLPEKAADESEADERLERAEDEHGLEADSIDEADRETADAS